MTITQSLRVEIKQFMEILKIAFLYYEVISLKEQIFFGDFTCLGGGGAVPEVLPMLTAAPKTQGEYYFSSNIRHLDCKAHCYLL